MNSLLFFKANHKYSSIISALISGFLLSCAWLLPDGIAVLIIIIGFVPLLLLKDTIDQNRPNKISFLWPVYLAMLVFNSISTWWVCNATIAGGLAAIVLNSALMCIPWIGFVWAKKTFSPSFAYLSFIVFWIGFEYVHLNWDLSWPWLTLGNALAFFPILAQWYEYTGVLGGSLWILLLNLQIYNLILNPNRKQYFRLALLLFLPISASLFIYKTTNLTDNQDTAQVIVVQPNIDPYNEKFAHLPNFIPLEQQLERFIVLSDSLRTTKTALVLWPETAFDGNYDEEDIDNDPIIRKIINYVKQYPNSALLTGIISHKIYKDTNNLPDTYRYSEYRGYYDLFNTAMLVKSDSSFSFYHKSKLVPGVEGLPYPKFFKFLAVFSIDLGGSAGGLGSQTERTVFEGPNKLRIAPTICYESIYGDFTRRFVKKGANLIAIITNDGWWGNTPGHRQHLRYAGLRAIETRRYIARSANTGISGFLDPLANIYYPKPYWQQHVGRMDLPLNSRITFYTNYGDWIGDLAILISCIFIIIGILAKAKPIHRFLQTKAAWIIQK